MSRTSMRLWRVLRLGAGTFRKVRLNCQTVAGSPDAQTLRAPHSRCRASELMTPGSDGPRSGAGFRRRADCWLPNPATRSRRVNESPVKNSEAIDASLLFKLSKYSILQESRGRLSVFLRFGIPDLGGS